MKAKAASIGAAVALVALAHATAQAQFEPAMPVCQELAALEVAWLNFDTQNVNATPAEVQQAARQVSVALDRIEEAANQMSPAAFDQLRQAHATVESEIDEIGEEATPAQVQDSLAPAKENERFAYQNFTGNIVCPPVVTAVIPPIE